MPETASVQQTWVQVLEELFDDIERWCAARGWATSRSTKPVRESRLGEYEAPMLSMHAAGGVIYAEPVARYVVDGDGLVDLYAWPTLRRVVLVRKGNNWSLKTDSGVPWPSTWGEQSFVEVVQALSAPS